MTHGDHACLCYFFEYAMQFEVTREFVELVYATSKSAILAEILKDDETWARFSLNSSELGRIVVIELLAYQFASPVQWIKTQDLLFGGSPTGRIIELGPVATLTGMGEYRCCL